MPPLDGEGGRAQRAEPGGVNGSECCPPPGYAASRADLPARGRYGASGSSPSLTGGAEAAGAARWCRRALRTLDDRDMLDARHNELGDAVAAADGEGLGAVIDEQHHDLAAIVGVDGAGAVEQRHAMLSARAPSAGGSAPRSPAEARWRSPSAPARGRPAASSSGCVCGSAATRSRPAAWLGLIGGKRQPLAMRQTPHAKRDASRARSLAHSAAERRARRASAARASSRAAISSLLIGGQSSTPLPVTI